MLEREAPDSILVSWLSGRLTRRQLLARIAAAGLTAPAAAALLAACGSGSSATPARTRIRIGIVQEPTSLDPTAQATASIALLLRDNLFEGVVRWDQDLKVVPGLARSWDVSGDGLTVTFHLSPGARFHDGTPLTAADVKYSWERAMDPATKPANPHPDYFAPVAAIDAVDAATVRVRLKTYSDGWLFHMGAGSAAIVSARSAATNQTRPVGSGPFKFSAWNKGATLSLTRNDAYWGRKAQLRDVEFHFISDANAMNNALLAGDLDAIGQVGGSEQVAAFKSDGRFRVLEGPPVGKIIVALNNSHGALADPRVRRAVARAIDRRAWIDGILSGYAVPIGSHAVPNAGEPYYVDETAVNTFDPAGARQLLQEAGYAGGLKLRLAQISQFPYAVRGTDILISELKDVGVNVDVQPMEFPAWLNTVFLGPQDYDMTIINHAEERDIGNYANPKYYWHYSNPQVTAWLGQADAEPDAGRRNSLYAAVQRRLAEDSAHAYVMSPKTLAVISAHLRDYPVASLSSPIYLRDTRFG